MNTTSEDYFTFNVGDSVLLVGQTGTGKSVLVEKLMERMVRAKAPEELKFALFDNTGVDYGEFAAQHPEYVLVHVSTDAEKALLGLMELANMAVVRAKLGKSQSQIVVLIEECDIAALDQEKFDTAVIKINENAKAANVKLLYSTSRPAPDVVSKKLIASFDFVLSGTLASAADAEHLGVPNSTAIKPYEFVVIEKAG